MLKSIELPNVALVRRSSSVPASTDSLADRLGMLLDLPDLDVELDREVGLEERLIHLARDLAAAAYPDAATGRDDRITSPRPRDRESSLTVTPKPDFQLFPLDQD